MDMSVHSLSLAACRARNKLVWYQRSSLGREALLVKNAARGYGVKSVSASELSGELGSA